MSNNCIIYKTLTVFTLDYDRCIMDLIDSLIAQEYISPTRKPSIYLFNLTTKKETELIDEQEVETGATRAKMEVIMQWYGMRGQFYIKRFPIECVHSKDGKVSLLERDMSFKIIRTQELYPFGMDSFSSECIKTTLTKDFIWVISIPFKIVRVIFRNWIYNP